MHYKVAWSTASVVLSPLVCPFLYFRMLRPTYMLDTERVNDADSQDLPSHDS